jgi:hypothetical protein
MSLHLYQSISYPSVAKAIVLQSNSQLALSLLILLYYIIPTPHKHSGDQMGFQASRLC